MFGLTVEKLAIVLILAVFIIGPDRLPLYAGRLAALVRGLRAHADAAKSRVTEQLGPDFDPAEWKKLDPRQYDPRRIIREALADDPGPTGVAPTVEPAWAAPAEPTPAVKQLGPVDESSINRLLRTSRNRAAELHAAAEAEAEAVAEAQASSSHPVALASSSRSSAES